MAKKENKAEPAVFDWMVALMELQCPNMWKAGFESYINNNNITIKSEKEFKANVKKYANLKIGE